MTALPTQFHKNTSNSHMHNVDILPFVELSLDELSPSEKHYYGVETYTLMPPFCFFPHQWIQLDIEHPLVRRSILIILRFRLNPKGFPSLESVATEPTPLTHKKSC